MKKIILTIGLFLFTLAACNQIEPVPQHLSFDFTITHEGDTKAFKSAWTDGDIILVFFDKEIVTSPRYLKLTYNGSKWIPEFNETTLETYLLGRTSGDCAAVYSPFAKQWQVNYANANTYEITPLLEDGTTVVTSYYMDCRSWGYSVSDGKLSAQLDMTATTQDFVHFYIPECSKDQLTLNLGPTAAAYVKMTGIYSFNNEDYYGSFNATMYETPMTGFLFDGGVSFTGDLRASSRDVPAGEVITVVDHSTTPTTTYTGHLSSAKTLKAHNAVVLPKLTDSFWTVTTP